MTISQAAQASWEEFLPDVSAWVFTMKTFVAAMLALYIAFRLNLDRPYWAMASVYIASQPYSGATKSKALYRAIGTVLGATGAVLMVPVFVDTPELLCLALTTWIGACLYISLLDRTPRSYVAMLAGYSIAIIAFPTVDSPGTIFSVALARVEEILLGITVASLVNNVVFPRSIAPLIAARIEAWLAQARRWARETLGAAGPEWTAASRGRLLADAADIDLLVTQLPHDASAQREMAPWVRMLRLRMLLLLPVLGSIADRLGVLRADDATVPPALSDVLGELGHWLATRDPGRAAELRRAIDEMRPALGPESSWNAIVLANLLIRLRDLLDIAQDCEALQAHIAAGRLNSRPKLSLQEADDAPVPYHKDQLMALLSAVAAAASVLLTCVFWIGSAWPEGFVAAEMAAVVPCFFATADNPLPGMRTFLIWSAVAVVVDAIYLFAILPAIGDFEMLALVLAPTFLLYGLLVHRKSTAPIGMALAANGATLLALQSTYSADFASFANSGIALIVGMAISIAVVAIMRVVGAEWSVARLIRANWASLADAAEGYGRRDRAAFAAAMLDRLGLAAPRLAALGPDAERRGEELLAELRIGLNIVDLRRARWELNPEALAAATSVLDGIGAHFRRRARAHPAKALAPPGKDLLARIDTALRAVAANPAGAGQGDALLGLVGVRRGLFPKAAPYVPTPEFPGHATDAAEHSQRQRLAA